MKDIKGGAVVTGIILAVLLVQWIVKVAIPAILTFLGWVLAIAGIVFAVGGVIWFFVEGVPYIRKQTGQYAERRRKEEEARQVQAELEERIRQQALRQKEWAKSPQGELYQRLELQEDWARQRVSEIKDALADNKAKRDIYARFVEYDDLLTVQEAQKELKKIDEAIEKREMAIKTYKAGLGRIEFQKTKIEVARTDFMVEGSAQENFEEAQEFAVNTALDFILAEKTLENLHHENRYGKDSRFENRQEGVLDLNARSGFWVRLLPGNNTGSHSEFV